MRAPLSWLRDFAPFPDDTAALVAALDDLGLVVEGIEQVGEGLEDVVVSRVTEIAAIEGADRIRRVVVDAGDGAARDRLRRLQLRGRRPGAAGPGRRGAARRDSRSAGARCAASCPTGCCARAASSGSPTTAPACWSSATRSRPRPGTPLAEALGLEPDTVFDITVEGNRPDAWCMAGVARDLAARLGLPFTPAGAARAAAERAGRSPTRPAPRSRTPTSAPA